MGKKKLEFKVDKKNILGFLEFASLFLMPDLRTNFEIFLLPGELLKQKKSTIKVCFGDVIEYNSLDLKKDYKTLAQEINNLVYDLKK
jgi:hypothetical protein